MTPLLWTVRFAAALGLTSLTLTGEITPSYWGACWLAWLGSFWLDRYPEIQKRFRSWETAEVGVLITVFLLDFFFWSYSIFVSMAHFLLLFQFFKLIGAKMLKDNLQIFIFSFFQILSACTLSVDAWHGLILLLLIPTATAALFWLQVGRDMSASGEAIPSAALKPYRRLLGGMCVAALPLNLMLAVAMFMIFPRLAFRGAFAGLGSGRSGYNDQVNLAQTGLLETDNNAVLWLKLIHPEDRSRWSGYLRGATLDYFDGKKWGRSRAPVIQSLGSDSNGVFKIVPHWLTSKKGLPQTITLVNTSGSTLFATPYIGEIVAPLTSLQYYFDGSVHWSSGWRKPLQYEVLSFDTPLPDALAASGAKTRLPNAPDYLQLPAMPFTRTRLLTRQVARGRTPLAQAQAIADYLHRRYHYSLDLGSKSSDNPVEDFLFVRQQGPCGHFASAMTLMLRLKGIPARLVAGYWRGSWNSQVGQYLIRERDAHAWVEAYLPGQGWVRFDPSPRSDTTASASRWVLRLQETWDYLNYQWDRLVIEYDLYSQLKVVEDIQSNSIRINSWFAGWLDHHLGRRPSRDAQRTIPASSSPRVMGLSLYLIGIFAVILALGTGVRAILQKSTPVDPAIAFYQKFLRQTARAGCPKVPSETGWEYADRLQRLPSIRWPVRDITERYYRARFATIPVTR